MWRIAWVVAEQFVQTGICSLPKKEQVSHEMHHYGIYTLYTTPSYILLNFIEVKILIRAFIK